MDSRKGVRKMKATSRVLVVVSILFLLAGCGGGGSSSSLIPPVPPPVKPSLNYRVSAIPNNHTTEFKKQAVQSAGIMDRLFPTAYAQNPPAAVMVGNYSGYCQQFDTTALSQPSNFTLFGLGTLTSFDNQNQNKCGRNFNIGGVSQDAPAPIIGNGTLQGLVALDSISSVSTGVNTGVVSITVIRGVQQLPTGIACTLGVSNRCQDTLHTFAVLDGDGIVVTITLSNGDSPVNLQAFIGKL